MRAAAQAQHRQQQPQLSQPQAQQAQQQSHLQQQQQQMLQQQQSILTPGTHGALQSPSRGLVQRPPTVGPPGSATMGIQQAAATPPPRMHPHSQSPRFHQQQQQHQIHLLQLQQQQQQRQLLELQEQRERHERQQLLELQEQLKLEELERQQRQLRIQQQQMVGTNEFIQNQLLQRGISPSLGDRARRGGVGRQSPGLMNPSAGLDVPFGQTMQYLPQNIQMQQRLLAEMAQAEFLSTMQGPGMSERDARETRELQEMLRVEAMRKIMEAERMEEKRKRKLDKIAHMSRYNDLMTQSDKDFITRIQVSQLVTQDPYADDFYAQVYGAILRSRMGIATSEDRVLRFGSGGGVGLGLGQKIPAGRRQNALQRMEAQVERIVSNARLREKEKASLNNLQGALGRTAGRSYKAAPRQLLQVDASNASTSPTTSHATAAHISKQDIAKEGEGVAREAAKMGREALATVTDGFVHKDPLTHRESLVVLEQLYDLVLEIEQRRRDQPAPEEVEAFEEWTIQCEALIDQLFDKLMVSAPLETSNPHPFVSLITPIKGKRILPRVARLFDTTRMQIVLTLIVACFFQLDVVHHASRLDTLEDTREIKDLEAQTQAFSSSVIQSILPVIGKAQMRLVTGLFGILLEKDAVAIARTRPGIALLTLFLSRVEILQHAAQGGSELQEPPSAEEMQNWYMMFSLLFEILRPHFPLLFPSFRLSVLAGVNPSSIPNSDVLDQPVWQFLSLLAVHANEEQQQALVGGLRDMILENVISASKGFADSEESRRLRLANVNLLLHALGLDASQISV
ncbi:hypothetical protein GSI_12833 [Ganoderma sinense ZZ0214-1]|uniref:mRNA decay factor PAT1 domain-containing protein n=1 Tax=Ganoderma sinense ZZ0214-1 TaxID=1077348 RepID=A0A2G8RTV3_9APHY|nr:hypothetical protein GSI_12833 [Ganoderma sinense ZZ0214-1]